MIVLEGQQALSPFRRERLEARLEAICPGVRVLQTRHVYWVEILPGQTPDMAALCRILQAGETLEPVPGGAVSRYVSPRLGTISPWASKATEILRGAGLPVRRAERGMRVDLAGWPDDPALQAALAKLLHDPMTQVLLMDVLKPGRVLSTLLRHAA